jgi:glycosyltransferase involved in cell wall biosynthesis
MQIQNTFFKEVIFFSNLKKLIVNDYNIKTKDGVIYVNRFCALKQHQFEYYTSKEEFILLQKPKRLIQNECIKQEKFTKFTIVWIGTPVTYHTYLENLAPVFQKLTSIFDYELLVIAKESLPIIPGVPQKNIDWSEEVETALLSKCHVGIMPLVDDQFARGKSAYKLIQYQAAKLPSIASPVGENINVIKHDYNGFLATTNEDWIKYLTLLNSDEKLLSLMGKRASDCAYEYSLEKYGPIFNQFLLNSLQ